MISIEAEASWFFWKARPSDDSLQAPVLEHYKALNRGLKIGGSIMYHFASETYIGITYYNFNTSHTTEPNHWIVPVTDANNLIVIDSATGQVLRGPRYGSISEQISLEFYGVRLGKQFEIDSELSMAVHFTPGLVTYREKANFVGYQYLLEGSSLGIDIGLSGIYHMDMNWAAFARISLFNAVINRPLYTDIHQQVEQEPLDEAVSLTNISLGGGLRYTFNKKNKNRNTRKAYPSR